MKELLSISEWVPVDASTIASLLNNRKPSLARSIWLSDGRISPRDLYCYMKARFGPPNGIAMLLRQPSSDNLIQWEYTVRAGDEYLILSGTNRTIQFVALGRETLADADRQTLVANLKADFANRGSEISVVRNSLEQWELFTNPYTRLNRTVDTLLKRLKALDLTEPVFVKPAGTRKELNKFQDARFRWIDNVAEARLLGTSLRMLVPVLGESFVNFLIFLLAKPEVARDERVMQDHLRQRIDVRIKNLPLFSRGYARPIDASHAKFKAFHSLMNNRNDLLHANVNPLRLKFDRVWFDGTIPLFEEDRSLLHRVICNSLSGIGPKEAISDANTVREFIDFLLDHLESPVAAHVRLAMEHEQLGYRPDTGRVGILFSNTTRESILGEGP